MKKSVYAISVLLLGLFASCGGGSSSVPSTSSSEGTGVSESVSSSASEGTKDASFYLGKLKEEGKPYYSIALNYRMVDANKRVYGTGSSRKSVYSGTSEDGSPIKRVHISGYDSVMAPLDENAELNRSDFDIYYSPVKRAELKEDGTYAVSPETHPDADFEPYSLGLDFSSVSEAKLSIDGFSAVLKGSVGDADVSSFLGDFASDSAKEGISGMTFTAELTAEEGYVQTVGLSYVRDGYTYSLSYAYTSSMSPIALPASVTL